MDLRPLNVGQIETFGVVHVGDKILYDLSADLAVHPQSTIWRWTQQPVESLFEDVSGAAGCDAAPRETFCVLEAAELTARGWGIVEVNSGNTQHSEEEPFGVVKQFVINGAVAGQSGYPVLLEEIGKEVGKAKKGQAKVEVLSRQKLKTDQFGGFHRLLDPKGKADKKARVLVSLPLRPPVSEVVCVNGKRAKRKGEPACLLTLEKKGAFGGEAGAYFSLG